MKFGLGQSVPRHEDPRLLSGLGRYSDDINLPDQLYAHVVRSPFARANIRGIDSSAALAAPGVVAVYTGEDIQAAGLGPMPCLVPKLRPQFRPDGSPMFMPPRYALAHRRVAFVGDAVAMVVARTKDQARDAAELVDVDYEELPANVSTAGALDADAVAAWEECPDNISYYLEMGDADAVKSALAGADHVVRFDLPITRVGINPMEPRAAVGDYDPREERYTLYTGTQMPHDNRMLIAEDIFGLPESQFRIVSPDMGGSFGLRATIFPELVLVLWASKNLGRPVKWLGDRSEGFMGDDHGRDSHYRVALGLDKAGHFLALDIENVSALGAYVGLFGPFPSFGNMGGVAGTYVTPAISAKIWGVLTNTTPTAPYRGAGRPEATMAIELAIDRAAREMGIDRVELRRLNLISPDAMPYQTPLTYCYDCGDFEKNMAMAMELGDWSGFAQRQAQSRKRGALRGIGFVNAIEQSAGLFDEGAEISIDSHGVATVLMGTHSHGQGHETVFRQLLSERLGLDFEAIRYVQGDTDRVPYGHGTGGSRVSGLGGAALAKAAELLVDKGRAIAATTLESAVADIEFTDGRYNVAGTDLSVTLQEIARIANSPVERPADAEPGFRAFGFFKPAGPTYPNGCHICEVEIEIETGVLRLDRYCVADDVGTVLNPLLLHGQVHGGIVQGASQIMMEQIVFDPESGQLLTGSFMDYCMPRADDMPNIEVAFHEVPTPTNPLGVKGAGECGTVGALACVMSATLNALESVGITEIDMPATSERLWQALRDAGVSA